MEEDPELLTRESFENHVGTVFTVVAGGIKSELTLQKIVDQAHLNAVAPDGHPVTRRTPFSLTLVGPKQPQLPQGTYVLAHPAMGELVLFMKPFHETAEATFYDINFN